MCIDIILVSYIGYVYVYLFRIDFWWDDNFIKMKIVDFLVIIFCFVKLVFYFNFKSMLLFRNVFNIIGILWYIVNNKLLIEF